MIQMEEDLFQLYTKIRKGNPSIEECPANPSPSEGSGPGAYLT